MAIDFEKTYQNNMEYLAKHWEKVYTDVLNANIDGMELLEVNNNINISVHGNLLYPNNVDESISTQVNTFLDNPTSFFKKPTRSSDEGKGYLHDKFVLEIEALSPYLKEKIFFNNYYHNLDNLFPYLLILGIGSGKHIEKLIQTSDIKNLSIIDQDYSFLKISMHIIDWRPIIDYFRRDGYNLTFSVSDKPEVLAFNTINTLFKDFPYHIYYIPYLTHYNSEFFIKFKETYVDKIHLGLAGLGFYDDELMSLNYTIENIKNNRPIFMNNYDLPENATVFIVASGPSIDQDIESIKNHSEKAIIISCGSSLKILEANNIVPDFHLESERTSIVFPMLSDNVSKEYLKKINFIGLNVIYPEVFTLFKTTKIFFRENDAGASIAPDNVPQLQHCNPTAVNAALSFASECGFKNIFLFGTDMGFKDETYHHSKYTAYHNKASMLGDWKPETKNKTHPGNFNIKDEFLSTDIFIWCKQRAENCIMDHLHIRNNLINYFNCSDGLKIKGATPIRSSKIMLNQELDKKLVLKGLENKFDYDYKHIHNVFNDKLENEKEIFLDNIEKILAYINSKPNNYSTTFNIFDKTFKIACEMDKTKQESTLTRSLFRGTFYHFYSTILTHALATTDKDLSIEYINNSFEKVNEFLNEVKISIKTIKID